MKKIPNYILANLAEVLRRFQDKTGFINFNPGPACSSDELVSFIYLAQTEPNKVFKELNIRKGVNVLDLSHRDNPRTLENLGIGFERDVLNPTIDRIHELYGLSKDEWAVFFVPGGATQMFDLVAQNFGNDGDIAYVDTGDFSQRFGNIADARLGNFQVLFTSNLDATFKDLNIQSLLVTANATVEGFRFGSLPEGYNGKVILDFTSNMFTEQIDWSKIKMAFGSTTKMLGTSGATLVIVRKEALESEKLEGTTIIANLQEQFKANGLLNTPCMYAILSAYYQVSVIENKGGIDKVNEECKKRSQILYDVIEDSDGFYKANVKSDENKSIVNVVFSLETEELWNKLLDEAESIGITGLKGHKNLPLSIRASMYLDTPYEWAEILAGFMIEFQQKNK